MATYQTFNTAASNPIERNFYYRTYSRGAVVVPGTLYGEVATALWVGGTGNLILEGVDGVPVYFANVPVGRFEYKHIRVLSAATINSIPYTTTATLMTWMGGEH